MQDRLSSLAGIEPTTEWLGACTSHLRQVSLHNNEDEVLHQIIHTDLRNVVRRLGTSTGRTDGGGGDINRNSSNPITLNENGDSQPSYILRRSISQSSRCSTTTNGSNDSNSNSSSNKATLPENFRLMVQIEEFLDVSLNAEDRLSLGPASSTSPPVGNQRKRCLKLLLSDGYYKNGSRCSWTSSQSDITSSSNSNNNNGRNGNENYCFDNFVGMETQPIPHLSVHSKPGLKVMLKGPINIFMGILMLGPSNTIILGGCIPSLIPIQKKAIACAARLAGVGIDATYRALVWNPDTGMEEENDEGDHASGDVQSNNNNIQQQRRNGLQPIIHERHQQQQRESNDIQHHMATDRANATDNERIANTNTSNNHEITGTTTVRNVYTNQNCGKSARSTFSSGENNSSSSSSTPAPMSHNRTKGQVRNVYSSVNRLRSQNSRAAPSALNQTINDSTINTSLTASSSEPQISGIDINKEISNTYSRRIPKPNDSQSKISTSQSSASSGVSHNNTCIKNSSSSKATISYTMNNILPLSPTALSEPLSFSEMRHLLEKMLIDPEIYEEYSRKTFIVPCKMHSRSKQNGIMGFNIEKNKNYKVEKKEKKGKAEKHHYVIVCKMAGANEKDGAITCRMSNNYLQPFFKMGASEMRKISLEDKSKANKIANESGQQVVSDLTSLAPCELRLLHSKNEFFSDKESSPFHGRPKSLDGDVPILLCARKSG